MLPLITVLFSLLFLSSVCAAEQCSSYHYEKQTLAKVVLIEQRLEQLEKLSHNVVPKHCPDGWIQFTGSCYTFLQGKRTFTEATLNCLVLNAHVVHIESEAENKFLVSHLNSLKDWGGTGPDNAGDREHCTHLNDAGYQWNDVFCGESFKSICEMKLVE